MKLKLLMVLLGVSAISYAQHDNRISTMDFIEVLGGNKEEAIFYYQNNWKVLREMALKKDYIASFQFLETPSDKEAPFQFILITTYPDREQYDLREDHFTELIKEKGGLELMNDKKPGEFRKTLFNKEGVRHFH
ncbi:hypothetical protein FNH22_06330 [Fulvivirga sp. M361]|uniref:hypothetical protein n=1 Tax=Fulvivirga sp. M361 TaxID=2594266 RepID=UPI00117993FB|nr:hypothetical protein [Fulvivirga sp. M361]TRX60658.1 hypothetical protein FNH22_06330 [Fulvivirga sp. M361]